MLYSVKIDLTDLASMTAVFPSRAEAVSEVRDFMANRDEANVVAITEPYKDGSSIILRDTVEGKTMRIIGTIIPTEKSTIWTIHEFRELSTLWTIHEESSGK